MAGIRLKHVERFRDRHGKTRFYYRIDKGARIALAGVPGTDEFLRSWQDAAKRYAQPSPDSVGTFNALARLYYGSSKFKKLKPSAAYVVRLTIDNFLSEHGHRMVAEMSRANVEYLFGKMSNRPAAANNWLKRIRVLIKFAISLDWIARDVTQGIEKYKEGTFHTWTESEIARFENHWPIGSRERLGFALALYTGQRRDDLRRMSRDEITDGKIFVVQQKTGAKLLIPLHPALRECLGIVPQSNYFFVATNRNECYTVGSFGHLMADAIAQAGLPKQCVLHGLRKAAARRLAEAGCTVHQIAAITGHKTLSEVERYTREASQTRLAEQAIASLGKPEIV